MAFSFSATKGTTKVILFLLVALAFYGNASGKKLPKWWIEVAQKQGPNACVVEEIPGTNKEFWTECRYWLNRKICGKKTRIRFECCEGFEQIDGEKGCKLVKPLKNLLETAEALGATKWAQYIRESGLQNELESAGAFTLFAPTNDAFDNVRSSLREQMYSYRGNPNNPILLYHIVPSKLRSEDFDGDMTVETRHRGHHLRINKYSNGMTTINCALLARKDQEATNGIVHLIDDVLDPSKASGNNVADIIMTDGRYQVLAEMLDKSGYINVLRTLQDSITFLAPSDEAFQKLPDTRRNKIINDREARLALLQNHIIPHVICESAITGEHKVRTMLDNKLTFNCDIRGAFVEKTKLRGKFNLGKNGILHMIDDVLLPDRAKNLIELAESRNLPTFVDFVKKSGLEETLSHTGDYTFFVPQETAWLKMPPEAMAQARRDPEYAGLMLRYHGAYGRHMTNDMTDSQAIMSLDEENPVRLQVWRRGVGVEDARIEDSDIEAQNGVIHIINKVIFPSNQTLQDILGRIPGQYFDIYLEALDRVTKRNPQLLNLGPGAEAFYTFFVPTDAAFAELERAYVDELLSDISTLTIFVKSHIAANMFPETAFQPGLIYSVEGMEGNINIQKNDKGKLKANGIKVSSSHMSASGVIHIIDKAFRPGDSFYTTASKKTSISSISRQGSSSRTYTTHSTKKTSGRRHHQTITYTEEHGGDADDILPAFPQGDKRFNYVGHHYGNDVVGHSGSSALPFSSPESTYVTRNTNTTEVKNNVPLRLNSKDKKGPGVSTITHSRRVGVSETIYSYPVGVTSTFSFPVSRKPFPSTTSSGKKHSDSFSAYAFTRGEKDFADGTEFAESIVPPEKVITKEQARILRRQWRKKRQHQRRKHRRRRGGRRLGMKRVKNFLKKN